MKKPRGIKVVGVPEGFQEMLFTSGEVSLNYVVGPENGLPLLLIPGQMEAWQGHKCVLPELSKRFHVFVPDMRGHGKSTWTPGQYSYNICGNDLKHFLQEVIQKPAIVSGLSSGGVLAIWLAANCPEDILAVIGEDPPIFSSIWPRIQDEKYLARNFQVAIDTLGKPGERDTKGYLSQMGVPVMGKSELMKIPSFIVNIMYLWIKVNQAIRPNTPYDIPFLPFSIRAGYKSLCEYDTDFARATIDGDLSKDFSPEETLKRIQCPMLLMRVPASRHEVWGILGAIDDNDLERIVSLVADLKWVEIPGGHAIHQEQPVRYVEELTRFVDDLQAKNKGWGEPPVVK